MVTPVKPLPGTYALVLRSDRDRSVQVGRWGRLQIHPGYYLYVGSAFGPGGVRARVSRHCRATKTMRWHIDYLRAFTRPVAVWCNYDPMHHEHHWAEALAQLPDMSPVTGFGCSDCRCRAHLFFSTARPRPASLAEATGGRVEACRCEGLG
jgi:Uri superfamily endonuclease